MTSIAPVVTLCPRDYDAVLFDLDGVMTRTASVHAAVLEAAGILQLFDARVDGVDITHLGLNGKPVPDTFLEAAQRLKADRLGVLLINEIPAVGLNFDDPDELTQQRLVQCLQQLRELIARDKNHPEHDHVECGERAARTPSTWRASWTSCTGRSASPS